MKVGNTSKAIVVAAVQVCECVSDVYLFVLVQGCIWYAGMSVCVYECVLVCM